MIEIRDAGAMGFGVFARVNIPPNQWLGEYIGEIRPIDTVMDPADRYIFHLGDNPGVCMISKSRKQPNSLTPVPTRYLSQGIHARRSLARRVLEPSITNTIISVD